MQAVDDQHGDQRAGARRPAAAPSQRPAAKAAPPPSAPAGNRRNRGRSAGRRSRPATTAAAAVCRSRAAIRGRRPGPRSGRAADWGRAAPAARSRPPHAAPRSRRRPAGGGSSRRSSGHSGNAAITFLAAKRPARPNAATDSPPQLSAASARTVACSRVSRLHATVAHEHWGGRANHFRGHRRAGFMYASAPSSSRSAWCSSPPRSARCSISASSDAAPRRSWRSRRSALALYNTVAARLRDRGRIGDQIGDLSRGTDGPGPPGGGNARRLNADGGAKPKPT